MLNLRVLFLAFALAGFSVEAIEKGSQVKLKLQFKSLIKNTQAFSS